jgi:integrase
LLHNDVKKGNKEIIQDFIKIGLYSGMRLDEIGQLRKENIVEIDGVMCFELVEDIKAGKTLKTKSSKRIIPIHSQITDIVDKYLTTSETNFLMWSGSSNRNSDRIGEYIRLFITDEKKVFHSTRKNFAQELYKHPECQTTR